MTEPPEPHRPEEGDGEEDYDAAWESITPDELMDHLESDALMDSIQRGVRGDLGTDELTELLGGLRDIPDSVDEYPTLTGRVQRGENILTDQPSGNGGSTEMSINENAAQLAAIADDTTAQGMIAAAKEHLDAALGALAGSTEAVAAKAAQAGELLGGAEGSTIRNGGSQVVDQLDQLMGMYRAAQAGTEDVNALLNALNTSIRDAAQRHGGS